MKSPFGQNRATKNLTLFPKNQKDDWKSLSLSKLKEVNRKDGI